jgi:hypothetical protein
MICELFGKQSSACINNASIRCLNHNHHSIAAYKITTASIIIAASIIITVAGIITASIIIAAPIIIAESKSVEAFFAFILGKVVIARCLISHRDPLPVRHEAQGLSPDPLRLVPGHVRTGKINYSLQSRHGEKKNKTLSCSLQVDDSKVNLFV